MAVTIKQIAEMAGVGPTTVTLVLKDSSKISAETKRKVLAVIEQMDYVPNHSGKLLKQGRTDAIAVLSSYFQSIFKMEFVNGVEHAIANSHYQLRQFYSDDGMQYKKAREVLYGKMADAIIAIGTQPPQPLLEKLRKARKPLILVEDVCEGHSGIRFDNHAASELAVKHLAKHGRKRIAIVLATRFFSGHSFVDDRLSGYTDTLDQLGLAYREVLDIGAYTIEDGRKVLKQLESLKERPDAIFFASGDATAAGFLQEAQNKGLRVPDDLAVIGFDDSIIAQATTLGLTSVRQPIHEMGKAAYELAVSCIEGDDSDAYTRMITFQPSLTIRQSG